MDQTKVIFSSYIEYHFANSKSNKCRCLLLTEQQLLDTAIDEGGPLRQFKADVWKQFNMLSIPVWGVMIRLFEDAANKEGTYVLPITNATLESRIKSATHGNAEEFSLAIQRAKDYTRAIGRIMLHSFLHGHTVSSTAMAPFFINGEHKLSSF